MSSPKSGLTGVACDNCIFWKKSGSERDVAFRICNALPQDLLKSDAIEVSTEGYCALWIQRWTWKKFADLLSEHEALKGAK